MREQGTLMFRMISFRHESALPVHGGTENNFVEGFLAYLKDSNKSSTVTADKSFKFTGDQHSFTLLGSKLSVAGDFISESKWKFGALGGKLTVKGDHGFDLGTATDAVILATETDLSNMKVGDNSIVYSAANDYVIEKNFELGEETQFLDATYADAKNEDGSTNNDKRLHFPDDHAHHGLTFDELVNVMAGKRSDTQDQLTDDELKKLYYDINKIGSLNVNGKAVLKTGATYDANGNVTVGDSLELAEGSQFLVRKGDATIANGSKIEGIIGIDKDKTFAFNAGEVSFTKDQDQIAGTLAINNDAALRLNNVNIKTGLVAIDKNAKFFAEGNSSVNDLNLKGHLHIGSATSPNYDAKHGALTVNGNFTAEEGSVMHFGITDVRSAVKADDFATFDKDMLIIKGDATGSSSVVVKGPLRSVGSITKQGILLVNVEGKSDLTLKLADKARVTSGGTEYHLVGRQNTDKIDPSLPEAGGNNSWYLSNVKNVVTITPIPQKPGPAGPGDDGSPSIDDNSSNTGEGTIDIGVSQKHLTPETGAYLANLLAANEMYSLKYHDRQYTNNFDGIWTRLRGSFVNYNVAEDRNVSTNVDYYTIHIGRDLWQYDEFTGGLMAAYGYSSGTTTNSYSEYKADHSSQGFAVGAYGSYKFNEQSYIDAWVQYVFMRNKVDGQYLETEKYNSKGFMASLEAGYAFEITDTFRIQPQAQFIWMGVKANDHREANGTLVTGKSGNLQSRIGARFYSEGDKYVPFAEVNYIHNTKPYKVSFSDDVGNFTSVTAAGSKNLYKLELGMMTKPQTRWTATGSVAFMQGSDSYRDTSVKIDVRYDF